MFSWVIQATFISIIFILLVHHLIQILKDTLTYPKVKDLVNVPTKKYEDIYNVLNQGVVGQSRDLSSDTTPIHNLDIYTDKLLPDFETSKPVGDDDNNMKNELKNFIKKQQHAPSMPSFSNM
jgi:hypothetical protein